MELIVLIGIAVALLVGIISVYFIQKSSKTPDDKEKTHGSRGVPQRAQEGIPRRAQIARNQRNRLRTAVATPAASQQSSQQQQEDEDDDSDTNATESSRLPGEEKMGAKKRAKLEAKAEKKAHREAELQQREEKKKRNAVLEEERKKQEKKIEEEERKQEEAEKLAREEQERKEYEEYLKMKQAFSVEEEGFEEGDDESDGLLQEFIKYIQDNKVVVLEDLANEFKLKTQQAIDRITELQKAGNLTGVIDDRGKFIYISEDELKAVAKFIRQRGRVSITELAECSNNLINLTPVSS